MDETCSANGILAPVVGITGSVQATEAIKVLSGIGEPLFGRLLLLDAATMEWRGLRLTADPACPVCGVNQGTATKLGTLP
jgi:adenylyltransferase/sulfurtransferase